jgi:MFS family permease
MISSATPTPPDLRGFLLASKLQICPPMLERESMLSLCKWPTKLLIVRGILVIFGGFLSHLALGSFYTFANIAPYIASYIRNQSHPSDLGQTTTSWIYACNVAGMGCTAWFGGWLSNKLGPRLTTLIGGWIMSAGVLLTYLAIKVSFWLVLLTYGIMFGVGMGVAYTAPLATAMKWMPRWKGVASGFVVSGFGLGALAFSPVQTLYVNPENIPSDPHPFDKDQKYFMDPELLSRVPNMFLILGLSFTVMQLIASILIANPPPGYLDEEPSMAKREEIATGTRAKIHEVDDVQVLRCCERYNNILMIVERDAHNRSKVTKISQSEGPSRSQSPTKDDVRYSTADAKVSIIDSEKQQLLEKEKSREEKSNEIEQESSVSEDRYVMVNLTPLQIIRRYNFYILWIMFMCIGTSVMFTSSNYKFFGSSFIDDDHFLATVASISSVFNCLGRISWGLFADRTSYRITIIILSAIMTIFTITFYWCVMAGEAMFLIWLCVIFFCIGGNYSVFPMAVGRIYGLKYVAANYGVLYTALIIAGVLGATVSSTLIAHVGYDGLLYIVGGFSFAGFLSALIYRAKIYIVKCD